MLQKTDKVPRTGSSCVNQCAQAGRLCIRVRLNTDRRPTPVNMRVQVNQPWDNQPARQVITLQCLAGRDKLLNNGNRAVFERNITDLIETGLGIDHPCLLQNQIVHRWVSLPGWAV